MAKKAALTAEAAVGVVAANVTNAKNAVVEKASEIKEAVENKAVEVRDNLFSGSK
ncbi:MAG TPA: hypothetical protein PKX08_20260 [Cyclobacteriaceae bacterium]|nr:hypothetical protein [Cyclobacteriaceae bacterium]